MNDSTIEFIRDRLDHLRINSSGFEDQNFEDRLATDFQSCAWELMVDRILLNEDLIPIGGKKGGPDFTIVVNGQSVRIEATTPGKGESEDKVPEHSGTEFRRTPDDQVILRFTAAIKEKSEHRNRNIEGGLISEDDPYIVAVSGSKIHESYQDFPSFGLRSTLGWSDAMYAFESGSLGVVDSKLQRKERVSKKSGVSISCMPFLDTDYSGISAILWSTSSICSFRYELYEDLSVIHNPLARNPIPIRLLPKASEYWTIVGTCGTCLTTYKIT